MAETENINLHYIESGYVTMFPSGFRGSSYIESSLTTEKNLRSLGLISSHQANNRVFIPDPNTYDTNTEQYTYSIIILDGYYFRIQTNKIPEYKYAYIKTRNLVDEKTAVLANLESTDSLPKTILDEKDQTKDYFYGLGFADVVPDSCIRVQIRDVKEGQTAKPLLYQPLRLSADEINNGDGKSIIEEFKTKKITKAGEGKLKIDANIIAGDDNNTNNIVSIGGNISIKQSVEVNNNKLKINNASIQFPTSGTLTTTLIADTTGTNKILSQNGGVPAWITYDTNDAAKTVVMRDDSGNIQAKTVQANSNFIVSASNTTADNAILILESGTKTANITKTGDANFNTILTNGITTISANVDALTIKKGDTASGNIEIEAYHDINKQYHDYPFKITDNNNAIASIDNYGNAKFNSLATNQIITSHLELKETSGSYESFYIGAGKNNNNQANKILNLDNSGTLSTEELCAKSLKLIPKFDNSTSNYVSIFDLIYPIGSIYMSVTNANPGIIFGGTWEAWGQGRVPIGVNEEDTDFNTAEKEGGEKTHQLLQAEMPSHNHNERLYDTTGTGSVLRNYVHSKQTTGEEIIGLNLIDNAAPTRVYRTASTFKATTEDAGSSYAHNNLQPYITCYMWKKTDTRDDLSLNTSGGDTEPLIPLNPGYLFS